VAPPEVLFVGDTVYADVEGPMAYGMSALHLWRDDMVGVAATSGPGIVGGLFGRLYLRRLLRRKDGPAFPHDRFSRRRLVVGAVVTAGLAALWWVAAGQWLVDDLTRPDPVPVEAPEPPLPCVPLC
jgi:hypothetical protein